MHAPFKPNADGMGGMVLKGVSLEELANRKTLLSSFDNLRREDYLCLLRHAACIVGNSSSGLLEAPTFRVPAVNLGTRQEDRLQARNVINAPFDVEAIVAAIRWASSREFRETLRDAENPYGDGRSSGRILSILRSTPKTAKLLSKRLTY